MEPILKEMNPATGIEQILIFPAVYDDQGTLEFPVQVDTLQLTFHLDETACWMYKEPANLTEEVRCLIGDLIEKIHS